MSVSLVMPGCSNVYSAHPLNDARPFPMYHAIEYEYHILRSFLHDALSGLPNRTTFAYPSNAGGWRPVEANVVRTNIREPACNTADDHG